MAKTPFLERIQQPVPLLADGAMGTQIHRTGIPINACFDALNLTHPEIIAGIHADYIVAGARLIETNTFGANRYKLAEHGLGDSVAEINREGARLAISAVERSRRNDVYVAGAVGPLGQSLRPYGKLSRDDAHAAFAEQMEALAQAGVDLILLETFADHSELLVALAAARATAPHLPVVCQATFAQDDRTIPGYSPAKVAYELHKAGADVIGVNCGGGPSQISQLVQIMAQSVPGAILSALPNAGYPELVGGRVMYPAGAEYFGEYALTLLASGARIVGGCCGTTPQHIASMRQALDDLAAARRSLPVLSMAEVSGEDDTHTPERPTDLAQRLADGRFTVTVEVAPPRSYTVDNLIHNARLLRDAGADVLDVADTPAARMRMSPWAVAQLIQAQVGVETVLHFPTRGRNLLRIQGDLLAAHALGLRNLFVTMGDPTRIGDYPQAMDTYDIVPSKLIALIKHEMNHGRDQAGNSIGKPTAFNVGCALNMFADDIDNEIRVLGNKLEAGADFALGQAVFEPRRIEAFIRRYEEINGAPFRLPVLMGIMPLYSLKHAQFLHNEVPGISIPDAIMKRIEDAGDDAAQEGVRIAQELLRDIHGMVQGAYIIPAFGKYHLAAEVIDSIAVRR